MAYTNIEEYLMKSGIITEEDIKKLRVEFNLLKEEKSFSDFLFEKGLLSEEQHKAVENLKMIGPEKIKVKMIRKSGSQKKKEILKPEISENLIDTNTIFVELFDRYDIMEVIGRGAMSWIYKVKNLSTGSIGALKILKYAELTDSSQIKRFERETEVIKDLEHPNIVRLYEFGNALGVPYYVMDYIEGSTFEDYLSSHDLSVEDKVIIIEKIARAIHYAHIKGVIHRDLKPSNIMITKEGEPLLVDFGIAKMVGIDGSTLTSVGDIIGTPAYMAPEQALGRFTDHRGDVFSLGAILYECLTNFNPYIGETVVVTLSNIMSKDPEPPSKLKSGVNPMLDRVILKCLEKIPENRYQTAEELADDLEKCRKGVFMLGGAPSWTWLCQGVKRFVSRQKQLIAVVLVLALLAIIFFPVRLGVLSALRESALRSMESGMYEQASFMYSLLIPLSLNDDEYFLGRGICRMRMKQYAGALSDFELVSGNDRNTYQMAMIYRSNVYLLTGKYNLAIEVLNSYLKEYAPRESVYVLMAKAHMGSGNRSQAMTAIEKALELNPSSREAKSIKEQIRKSGNK